MSCWYYKFRNEQYSHKTATKSVKQLKDRKTKTFSSEHAADS